MKISKYAAEVINIVANCRIDEIPDEIVDRLDPCEIAEIISADLAEIDKNLIYDMRRDGVDDETIMLILVDAMNCSKFTDVYIKRATENTRDQAALCSIIHQVQKFNLMDDRTFQEVSEILYDEELTNITCLNMLKLVGTEIVYDREEFLRLQSRYDIFTTYESTKQKVLDMIELMGGVKLSKLTVITDKTIDAVTCSLRERKWDKVHALLETIHDIHHNKYIINNILKAIERDPDRIDDIIDVCYKYSTNEGIINVDLWIESGIPFDKLVELRRDEIRVMMNKKHVVEQLFDYIMHS